jgi:iron(III) transport system ATP-binding protein
MTVLENVMFPLSYRGSTTSGRSGRKDRRERGMEALNMVQLDHLADRDAPFLSGGQQQRVALARALVVRPKLLLLDEPLSNLDAKLREEMRFEIKELTGHLGISTIYVTHDQAEALSMSDRIAVMSGGKILQRGTPREIYLDPVSASVARIAGSVNVLKGTIVGSNDAQQQVDVCLASGQMFKCRNGTAKALEGSVEVMFRPELVGVRLDHEVGGGSGANTNGGSTNSLRGRVSIVDFTGDHLKVVFETADGQVTAKLPPDVLLPKEGDLTLFIKVESCVAQ